MAGLLDMLDTASQDPATAQGILRFGLSLLQSKGNLGSAIGQAGLQGLQGAQDYRQQNFQRQIQQNQLEQIKRQQELQKLPSQFLKPPSTPGIDATGGMETSLDNQNNAAGPGGFDMPGYIQALMGKDPNQALQLKALTAKQEPQLHTAKAGETLGTFVGGKFIPAYTAPAKPSEYTPTDVEKLINARDSLPAGHPNRKILDAAISKASTHSPGVNVTYGAPVAGVDAQGNQIFFQPGKNGGPPAIVPGVAPPKKELPAALTEKLAQNAVTLNKIDTALNLVQKNPESLGAQNVLGDPIMQRIDPKGVEVRAMIADIGGQKIHDRSGAAVTVGESERLKPYIPAATDNAATVAKKLRLFRNEYAAMQQAINSGASAVAASKVNAVTPASVRRFNPETGAIE